MTPPEPTDIAAFRAARADVLERLARACARVGRDPGSVQLIAVSKTVDPARLRAAVEAGLTALGENRVQEGEAKRPEVPGATWDLIGPLQSNKARRALETFDRIQSVDSVGLARRLDRLSAEVHPGRRYPVLLQVNVDEDPAKAGFRPTEVTAALDAIADLPSLAVDGLMTIGRFGVPPDETRSTFRALRSVAAAARDAGASFGDHLSMGMSDDYELAAEEGATIVRVGRALFGERPHQHGDGPVEHAH
ncbi:MAG TPA: YggS family pyridoxal phosphate-dependent enzyme [Candidatus Limnocylindrales bacterium]